MGSDTVLWAGKRLTDEEAAAARRVVELLERVGDPLDAAAFSRFLPDSDHPWTPDELELGAHAGPWLQLEGGLGA